MKKKHRSLKIFNSDNKILLYIYIYFKLIICYIKIGWFYFMYTIVKQNYRKCILYIILYIETYHKNIYFIVNCDLLKNQENLNIQQIYYDDSSHYDIT